MGNINFFAFIDGGDAWDHSLDTSKCGTHCPSIKVYYSPYNSFELLDAKIKFIHLEQPKFIKPILKRFSFDFSESNFIMNPFLKMVTVEPICRI